MKKLLTGTLILLSISAFAQTGIGTTTPNASAQLEVASTNKGFLPPRVALTSTTASAPLAAHVAGMVVYNTVSTGDIKPGLYVNNGTSWEALSNNVSHTIGESFGGGKVFFVTTDGLHGLIAETIDQSFSSSWYNTQNIISTNSTHSTAGKLFTDWRTPTIVELKLLYAQRTQVGNFVNNNNYWTSIEGNDSGAFGWYVSFNSSNSPGSTLSSPQSSTLYVRAIRSF